MSEETLLLLGRSYAPAVKNRLERLPSRDQLPIASWLVQNPVGTNIALSLLEQLEDLARLAEQSPANLLFDALASQQQDRLQPKEIGRRLRNELQRRLHPASLGHQEAFEIWQRERSLPEGARLKPPQNFEGKSFALEVTFDSSAKLKQQLLGCLDALDKPDWEKIWKF